MNGSIPQRVINLHVRAGVLAVRRMAARLPGAASATRPEFDVHVQEAIDYLAYRSQQICRERKVYDPMMQRQCATHATCAFVRRWSEHLVTQASRVRTDA